MLAERIVLPRRRRISVEIESINFIIILSPFLNIQTDYLRLVVFWFPSGAVAPSLSILFFRPGNESIRNRTVAVRSESRDQCSGSRILHKPVAGRRSKNASVKFAAAAVIRGRSTGGLSRRI